MNYTFAFECFFVYEIIDLLLQVNNRAQLLFNDVCNTLHHMSLEVSDPILLEGGSKAYDFRCLIAELEGMLQKEKEEFEVGCL